MPAGWALTWWAPTPPPPTARRVVRLRLRSLPCLPQFLEPRRADQDIGCRDVGGQRHVAHVADAQQRLDVRVVRVFVQRIDDEEDGVDLPLHDPAGDLHIATQWARAEALD